jgi:chemotaxis protein histidine kinase CheA
MDLLTFQLDGTRYALPLDAVAEVLVAPAVRRVPAGPPGVLGLAEACGRIVAVLDLAELLGRSAPPGAPRHLVRFAPPHDRSALAVGQPLGTGTGTPGAGHVVIAGVPHVLLDTAELLKRASGG